MNVTEALIAQAIGSIDRQIGNAVRLARSRGKVIALAPATMTRATDDERKRHTVTLGHQYMEIDPGQPAPPGWVIVDGEEP